jgi:D-alanyl-D-alanine carboxypeptidase
LHIPIRKYLPELTQTWADSVTTHHLLIHTHGITALDKALSFSAGTKYAYSQLGYELLAKITAKTSGKSFEMLSNALFKKCKMKNSFHPITNLATNPTTIIPYKNLVKGYTEQENGILLFETRTMQNHVAAGSFISTTEDLILWNKNLHNSKLLSEKMYNIMITKQKNATREHPLFGKTDYGYGITIENPAEKAPENVLKLGQTGFAPGFVSMNYYYPEKKRSVVVLSNVVWDSQDLKKAFYYHTEILRVLAK